MAKLKLTKNELRRQRDALVRFERYLPMLKLKKQQLQLEIGKVHRAIRDIFSQIEGLQGQVLKWVDVFAESVGLEDLFEIKEVKKEIGNIAGIDIPLFVGIEFKEQPYDFLSTPLWIDKGIEACKRLSTLKAKYMILEEQQNILQDELRIIVQRVNLFEKVKIPEARENIRIIQICLGDLQIAEVVRGKIAKDKLEKEVGVGA